MPNVTNSGRALRILGISLALFNLMLWLSVPTIRAAVIESHGWSANPHKPGIMYGVQELLVYFDPWLAIVVFPIIYIFGFAAIGFIKKPSEDRLSSISGLAYVIVVSFFLTACEIVWLGLIAVGVFLRGPNWNIFWPGEEWDEFKVVPHSTVELSEYFWHVMGRTWEPRPWAVRELPGLVLIGSYLLAGIFLAYVLFRMERRATPFWRWGLLVFLLQSAAIVPLKVAYHIVFSRGHWIFTSVDGWNL